MEVRLDARDETRGTLDAAGDRMQSYRILILEDDLAQIRLIETLLARSMWARFSAESAQTIADGVARLDAEPVDIVLFELGLLDSSGWATFEALQRFADSSALVVMSSSDEHCLKALQHGAQDCIRKQHLKADALSRALRFALERHRIQAAGAAGIKAAHHHYRTLNQVRDEFSARMSHDFRTPLTSLQLYAQLVQRVDGEKAKRYYAVIEEQCARLESISTDLLALARGRATDRTPPGFVACDVREMVRDALAARDAAQAIALRFPSQQTNCTVSADPYLLNAALDHVLRNALQYAPGAPVTVTVSADTELVVIDVVDDGPGIAPDEQPHVLEPFFRGRLAAQLAVPGHGLGLALSDDIIRLHGGSLHLESKPNSGTTVRLVLPLLTA